MKFLLQLKNLLLLTSIAIVLWSCDKDANDNTVLPETMTIVETAQAEDALSSLVSALMTADNSKGTDLVGTLSSEGPFTVFAPTNDAFAALLDQLDGFDSLSDFDTDEERELLTTILTYHVVAGVAAKSTDLSDQMTVSTVQGEDLTINLEGGVFIEDATEVNAEVVIADVMASNGVVHVIDKVMLPQAIIDALNQEEMTNNNGTLVDIVVATEPLSILEAAVIKADLVATLSSDGPFTVFAPTDDAFVALLEILGDDYNSLDDFDTAEEMALLKNILLYHVIPAEVKSTDLSAGQVSTAFEGNSVEIISSGETFVIGDASDTNANITGVDIMASNGVAHTIDKVLLPQSAIDFVVSLQLKTIVETAVATDDLSLLVESLIQADAGLVETLNGDGPFTVFAPTNAAFASLLDTLGDDYNSLSDFDTDEEKQLLVSILTYHVIAGTTAFSTSLSNGQSIETFQGENIGIKIQDGTVHVEDATDMNASVVLADVEASNGVVHVINKVLLPQETLDALAPGMLNIVETAQDVPDLSTLVAALIQADAGLVETLSGDGPFTVFAPTNDAFTTFLNDLGSSYNSLSDFDTDEEKALLAKLLTYHVVSGASVASTDLSDHLEIMTVQGESLFALLGSGVQIRDKSHVDANVITPDVTTSNGIVHVVDKVLLPQEIIDALH
ncbi:fasciclin domain-containing protein [Maribacter sp. MMG018]|uniref:fasciclin domain-containing protein n=1 Tax=Maribacter sp. MMG018 TaxID=2822688 RepID=UPI001B38D006|nr:fasciclin domain-containing protein [Maribacter sp. MMG018]MBQ4914471.1 fasciclin domain-containing protein [Maribacter sp. MMG018]